MEISVPSLRVGQRRGVQLSAAALLLVPAVLLVFVTIRHWQPPAVVPAAAPPVAQPTLDPSLVMRPHASHIALRLGDGISMQGTLAPTIPGQNVAHLVATSRSSVPVPAGQLTLTATMPGMAMPPIRAILHMQGRGFTGVIRLPMFGAYVVVATLKAPMLRLTGTMTVTLPLPIIGSK